MAQVKFTNERFFNELSKENQELLLSIGTEISAKNGTYLFHEGDISTNIYLITSGKIRISKMSNEGKEFTVHLRQKDELVGESGLFNDMSVSVTAILEEDTTLIKFDKIKLEKIFQENGEISVVFMKWFARTTQSNQVKFRDLILLGKVGALYSTLIRFANSYGVETEDGILIDTKLTNQDIANYIGTSRESANRTLNKLKRDGIVEIKRGQIIIKDMDYLKNYLQCGDCPKEICII